MNILLLSKWRRTDTKYLAKVVNLFYMSRFDLNLWAQNYIQYTTKYKTFSSNSSLVIILLLLFLMLLLLAVVFEQKPLKDKARHKLNIHCKIWNVHCIFKQLRELQILPLLRILNPLQYPYSLNLLHMQPLITIKGCLKLNIKYIFVKISDEPHLFGNCFRLIENIQSYQRNSATHL